MKKDPASSNTTPRQSRSNVVPLKGEIDLHVSPTVTAALNDVIEKKPERLVVDLSDVSYIDSAGLGESVRPMSAPMPSNPTAVIRLAGTLSRCSGRARPP